MKGPLSGGKRLRCAMPGLCLHLYSSLDLKQARLTNSSRHMDGTGVRILWPYNCLINTAIMFVQFRAEQG